LKNNDYSEKKENNNKMAIPKKFHDKASKSDKAIITDKPTSKDKAAGKVIDLKKINYLYLFLQILA